MVGASASLRCRRRADEVDVACILLLDGVSFPVVQRAAELFVSLAASIGGALGRRHLSVVVLGGKLSGRRIYCHLCNYRGGGGPLLTGAPPRLLPLAVDVGPSALVARCCFAGLDFWGSHLAAGLLGTEQR